MNKKIFNKVNENIILACFARSYDESHIKNKKIHLVSSVVYSNYEVNVHSIDLDFLQEKIVKGMYRSTYYIFNVDLDVDDEGFFSDTHLNVDVENNYFGCVRVINIRLFDLVRCIENEGKMLDFSENISAEIFGFNDSTKKDFDSILQDSVFIFKNIKWNSIVLFFKLRGIEISGGTTSKRHILDTVSSTLKEFLDLIYDYKTEFINKKIIYNSFKNKDGILSSFINFENKNDMDYSIEIKNMLIKDVKWNNIINVSKEFEKYNDVDLLYNLIYLDYKKTFKLLVHL